MKSAFVSVEDKARELCEKLAEMLGDNDQAIFEYEPTSRVEAIEHVSRDGFWAWTAGGFQVCLPAALSHHWGTGCAPAPIQPLIDEGSRIIADEWRRQNPDLPPLEECVAGDHGAELENKAQDWETDSWQSDEDYYFWKARVMFLDADDHSNETGEPEIYVDAYLNTDLNYGRDSIPWLRCYGQKSDQTCGDFKHTFTLDEFAALTDDGLAYIVAAACARLP